MASLGVGLFGVYGHNLPVGWIVFLITSGVVMFIAFVYLEFSHEAEAGVVRRTIRTDNGEVVRYLTNWIRDGGRVAIWSRDLSWANDESHESRIALEMLKEKARRHELIVCVPTHTSTTLELERIGARVLNYSDGSGYTPRVRFTIANFERVDSRVTFGYERTPNRKIEITEILSQTGDPVFSLAEDMIRLVQASQPAPSPTDNAPPPN